MPVFKTGAFNRSATSPIAGAPDDGGILPDNTLARFAAKPLNESALPLYMWQPEAGSLPRAGGAKMPYLGFTGGI